MRTDEAQKTCEKKNHFDKEEQYTVKVAPQDMHEKACTGETLKKKNAEYFFCRHWRLTGQEGKWGAIFIPLYHFHLLTNIQTLTFNFLSEMNTTYFTLKCL